MFTAIGFKPMTFQKYYDLLQSTAQRYTETVFRTNKSPRSVYMSDITQDDEEHCANAEEGYGIDTLVDIIQKKIIIQPDKLMPTKEDLLPPITLCYL